PVGNLEGLQDPLLDGENPLVLRGRVLRSHEREHLDLVELVDPEDPAGVAARGARLSAKAGRKATVTQRQLSFGKKVVRVQSCQAHLRGTDQVEVVVRHFIYLRAVGRQEAGPEERLLAYEHGRNDGDEPLRLERLER